MIYIFIDSHKNSFVMTHFQQNLLLPFCMIADVDILSKKAEVAIIEKQSPKIDVISGATINTRAMQKAVENALTSQNVH
jgi:hypothetical protein